MTSDLSPGLSQALDQCVCLLECPGCPAGYRGKAARNVLRTAAGTLMMNAFLTPPLVLRIAMAVRRNARHKPPACGTSVSDALFAKSAERCGIQG